MTNRQLVDALGVTTKKTHALHRGPQAARVVSYDAAEGTVSLEFVLPQTIRNLTPENEEGVAYREQPGMDNVPVAFLGTPTAGLTFALPPGTEGAFIPWERDHSGYMVTGQPQAELRNRERHTLGCGGYFIPMCVAYPTTTETDADGGTVVSGPLVYLASAAGAEAMARADRVDAQLQALAERLYFAESYINQMQPWLAAAAAYLLPLGVTFPIGQWQLLGIVPDPPAPAVPVGPWGNWAAPRPWLSPGTTPPAGYAGTGATGADRVRGV